jgi:monofunctional glycosyltransferase
VAVSGTVGRAIRSSVGALGAALFVWLIYGYVMLPDVRSLADHNPTSTAFMELRAREAIAEGRELRHEHRWVPYAQISPALRRAVLVAEDDAFFDHDGVDYQQLRRAIEEELAGGTGLRGASTITQQLAKNLYLTPSRNPLRKLWELIIARRLEAALPKTRILELYLNLIEWGDGVWGAEAAARRYFGISASAVGPRQAALLAGAIINPRRYSPSDPPARLLRRQEIILGRMGGPSAESEPTGVSSEPELAPVLELQPLVPPDAPAPVSVPDGIPVTRESDELPSEVPDGG